MISKTYTLSPSDLTFLYDGCKRCYYLKVVHRIPQPSIPLPSVFSKIASLLKDHYQGKHTGMLHPDLPSGIVKYGERYIKSRPILNSRFNVSCCFSGRFDILIEFDDDTYGVIDFKTGSPSEGSKDLYTRQLHAYTYALEHPAQDSSLGPLSVSKMGLLYFSPSDVSSQCEIRVLSYHAKIQWIEIDKNEQAFLTFVDEILDVLKSPDPPEPTPGCQWCEYAEKILGFT